MASERILHRSAGIAGPKFEGTSSRHLCRTARPSSAPTSSTSSSSTRVLQRDKHAPCRRGGGNKVSDALKTAPKRRPLNLEEDGTSDEDVMADEGSSSDEENIPPGRKLARNKRQRLMQMFSGLDSDGMRDEGDGSFLEDSAVRPFTIGSGTKVSSGKCRLQSRLRRTMPWTRSWFVTFISCSARVSTSRRPRSWAPRS